MSVAACLLSDGARLHLQHGPIDLIVGAEGPGNARTQAFEAAHARMGSVLTELMPEIDLLRCKMSTFNPVPEGTIARRMDAAVRPHCATFVTPMAAVAGAVADEVLSEMCAAASLRRAYVNNGGDIALHLAEHKRFTTAIHSVDGCELGRIEVSAGQRVGGIATSGRHGRSLSCGIADSVTILARSAAAADAAATLVANAVDLPGHPAVARAEARAVDCGSDLRSQFVVTGCGALASRDVDAALDAGLARAVELARAGHIQAGFLSLRGESRLFGNGIQLTERSLSHA